MKKILFVVLILMSMVLSSCTTSNIASIRLNNNNLTTGTAVSSFVAVVNASANNAVEGYPFDSIYDAYYQKYKELVTAYGVGHIVEISYNYNFSYLGGVCVAELLDFNGDGTMDLLVVYANGNNTGGMRGHYDVKEDKFPLPQAESYTMEIWTYEYGRLKQLFHGSGVSSFSSFNPRFSDYDHCFVTIFENKEGLPMIQFYSEEFDSCTYTNLYYGNGTVVKDQLTYCNNAFTMNGIPITEGLWQENICGYSNILFCTYLSSARSLKEGMNYEDTLRQTSSNTSLLKSAAFAEPVNNDNGYNTLYLQEIDRINRYRLDVGGYIQGFEMPYEYVLYDMDQNGVPELIVLTGSYEAAYMYSIYTVENNELVHCGDFSGSHTGLSANGQEGLVSFRAHMGAYEYNKITLEGCELKMEEITKSATLDPYPEFEDLGLENYTGLRFCYGTLSYGLYAYGLKE